MNLISLSRRASVYLKHNHFSLKDFTNRTLTINACNSNIAKTENTKEQIYFHISPSGDWWTGPSIFAAKHLQPDYVKSIPLPPNFDPEKYFDEDNDNLELLHQIYDKGVLPEHILSGIEKPEK